MTGREQQLCEVRIGTSGYDYPEWEGGFYYEGIGKSNYLGTYSDTFDTIELTSTFTTMPTEADMKKLIKETRKAMDFAVKAPMALFSSICLQKFDDTIGAFRKGIAPFAEGDKLCCVLLSFSKTFRYGIEERKYLNKILSALSMYPLVVEFNNNEWISARVLDGLKARGVGLCLHDMPHLEGLSIVYDVVTAPLAYYNEPTCLDRKESGIRWTPSPLIQLL